MIWQNAPDWRIGTTTNSDGAAIKAPIGDFLMAAKNRQGRVIKDHQAP
jgi:hypothetical protein